MAVVEARRSWGWLRIFKIIAITAASLLLLVIAVVGGWLFANRDTITIGRPGAQELLRDVIAQGGVRPLRASKVDYIEQDGTTPDTASQILMLNGPASSVESSLKRACRALRLDAPDAGDRAFDPSIRCQGAWHTDSVKVYLKTTCAKQCEADIMAEVY